MCVLGVAGLNADGIRLLRGCGLTQPTSTSTCALVQWVANLKMNGSVRAAAFSHSGSELLSTGGACRPPPHITQRAAAHAWCLRTVQVTVKCTGGTCGRSGRSLDTQMRAATAAPPSLSRPAAATTLSGALPRARGVLQG